MERPECKEDYKNSNLVMSEEKCDKCEYKYKCVYLAQVYNEIVEGD